MDEIAPGVWRWSWFSSDKGYDFNGHLVIAGNDRALIDPPPLPEADLVQLADGGPITAIIVTNRDHVREAEAYRKLFHAVVWAPVADVPLMALKPDRTYQDGDTLPSGMRAIQIPGGKSPGESALFLPRRNGIMILGDALIGVPPGRLNLMPPEKYADPNQARAGLRVLLGHTFEMVLVGDGTPILTDGRSAVEAFLR